MSIDSEPVSSESTPDRETILAVAKEFNLPPDHPVVGELLELRRDSDAAFTGLVNVMDMYVQAEELLDKYRIDRMTGLLVRDAFLDEVDALRSLVHQTATDGTKNHHNEAVLFMIDLKNLHGVNKKGGHEAGDLLIENTGRMLREIIGSEEHVSATPGRLGGDEFGIFLTFDRLVVTLDQVTQTFLERFGNWAENDTTYGARIGNPAISTPEKSRTDLLREADPKAPKSMGQRVGKFVLKLGYSFGRHLNSR